MARFGRENHWGIVGCRHEGRYQGGSNRRMLLAVAVACVGGLAAVGLFVVEMLWVGTGISDRFRMPRSDRFMTVGSGMLQVGPSHFMALCMHGFTRQRLH